MCLFKHFDSLRATMSLAVYAAVRCVSARAQIRATAVLLCTCAAVCVLPGASSFAQTCPTEDPAIDRQAIGGSAAHEAGHTYGLAHSDDDPPIDPCKPSQAGPPPTLGEDAFNKHLM